MNINAITITILVVSKRSLNFCVIWLVTSWVGFRAKATHIIRIRSTIFTSKWNVVADVIIFINAGAWLLDDGPGFARVINTIGLVITTFTFIKTQ